MTQELTEFIKTWNHQGDEVADKVTYWNTLLRILGVPQQQIDNKTYIDYEKKVDVKANTFGQNSPFRGSIDAYIPSQHILIEQKSFGVDLAKAERRNNGGDKSPITPYGQARRYDNNLALDEKAKFIVLSNFNEIWIYDVRKSLDATPIKLTLAELPKQISLLDFLVKKDDTIHLEKEKKISIQAGEIVAKIYNELEKQYVDPTSEAAKKSINTLCVRLVFCLYAEDAGLFQNKSQFHDYLQNIEPNKMGKALRTLFKVLDKPNGENGELPNKRVIDDGSDLFGPYFEQENPELAAFPFVNGGMFSDESIVIPPFTAELKRILLEDASEQFDWSSISPTIFGAVFESTLNPETRRQGGMHYTSVENIHKVIDPLFLNDLKAELNEIKGYKLQSTRQKKAQEFQDKLSKLTFFDPACGSGNFLTETFLQLRHLENEAIRIQTEGASLLDTGQADNYIKVSIQQFYGIEINDFAVSVAKTALWIAEDQMMKETQELFWGAQWDFLPLKTYTHIHEGNALRMDWQKVLPNYACHYVLGNPPFVGLSSLPVKNKELKKEQTNDMDLVFKDLPKHGKLDYVAGWYEKAANYMQNTKVKTAFVSTNSITQGEQVGILWKHLFQDKNVVIMFAYRSFVWNSQATMKAHVHCVIIGFTCAKYSGNILLFDELGNYKKVKQINGYLIDYSTNAYIQSRKRKPPIGLPEMHKGSQPTDGGNLILKNEIEYKKFIEKNPKLKPFVKLYIGSQELINNKKRYCLWLQNVNPDVFAKNKDVIERLKRVVESRKKSSTLSVRKNAEITPYLFTQIRQPDTDYIAVPEVSSENRSYIPVALLSKDVIASNKLYLIPSAQLWIFSILISKVHMAWMRIVSGRMKSDYSYSPAVYTNFPWLNLSKETKDELANKASSILAARKQYPNASLASLYNDFTMPADLRKAHEANDKAVLEAYGLPVDATESEIVAHIFKMYEKLTANK